jgi:hypothetical protein
MVPAEGVGPPERIPPGGQHRFFGGKGASSARQRRQGAHKGGIEPLDRGGSENGSARGVEHPGDGLGGPAHHPVYDLDHPPPGIALDDSRPISQLGSVTSRGRPRRPVRTGSRNTRNKAVR